MRRTIFAAALLATAALPQAAMANSTDFAAIKCSDLASISDEDGPSVFMWLVGYVSGKHDLTVVDMDKASDAGKALGEYCQANPDASLIEAAEASFK